MEQIADPWGTEGQRREFAAIWKAWSGPAGSRDPYSALPHLVRLADAGFAPAQHAVGLAYLEGKATQRDPAEGFRHLLAAAEQGYPESASAMGSLHAPDALHPDVCAEDPARAAMWFRRAAEAGNPIAQVQLAMRHRDGHGVGQDVAQAYVWACLAMHCSRENNRPAEFIVQQAMGELDELARATADAQVATLRRGLPLPWSVHVEYWKRLAQEAPAS